jgi:riboflavin kinase/FMN adenylyltransferase
MRVARWPENEGPLCRRSVATLGVFDGVHRGHKAVLSRVMDEASRRGCPSCAITFDRHPSAVLTHERQPVITSLDHRLRLFEELGLDLCAVVEFSEEVAAIPAERFAREVFHDLVRAEALILGFDCRFGRNAEGDAELCRRLAPELGFEVETVGPVEVEGDVVSSTAIRRAIQRGDLERAERLLGRPFALYGTVVHGVGRGRRIGFPTANLDLHNETLPPDGVYATWLYADDEPRRSVTSIGRQPTFTDGRAPEPVVEVHLLDRQEDLYGENVKVRFVERLREQRAFETAGALSRQIGRDIARAREVLSPSPEDR